MQETDMRTVVASIGAGAGTKHSARSSHPQEDESAMQLLERIETQLISHRLLPVAIEGQPPVVAEVPDAEDLIHAAARSGYVQWLFRPVRGGVWAEVADDLTLEEGGYRNPPCPYLALPTKLPATRSPRRIVYQFGRA